MLIEIADNVPYHMPRWYGNATSCGFGLKSHQSDGAGQCSSLQ